MRFVCPYCGAVTKHFITNFKHLGLGKCEFCKRKYRIVPIAVPEENPDGKGAQEELSCDWDKGLVLGLVIGLVVTGIIFFIVLAWIA